MPRASSDARRQRSATDEVVRLRREPEEPLVEVHRRRQNHEEQNQDDPEDEANADEAHFGIELLHVC